MRELRAITKVRSRKHSNDGRNVGKGISPVEGTTWRGQWLKCCKVSNKVFIAKVRSFLNTPYIRVKQRYKNTSNPAE
jgi:hypothetical protein